MFLSSVTYMTPSGETENMLMICKRRHAGKAIRSGNSCVYLIRTSVRMPLRTRHACFSMTTAIIRTTYQAHMANRGKKETFYGGIKHRD